MRKILIFTMAFLLPFLALEMRADDTKVDKKIPLRIDRTGKLSRDLDLKIAATYYETFSFIQTTIFDDLGEVELIVTNLSTGESWSCLFDSASEHQSILSISGSAGYYEVEYITESGDVYVGEFLIE